MSSVKLEGQVQVEWRWLIAAYLFLAGVGGGAYLAGVIADIFGGPDWMTVSKIGITLGMPCVLIGTMFLLADLGSPFNAWRVWMKPKTSWIARGTIIIILFMIFAAIHMGWLVWPFGSPLADDVSARHLVGVLGAVFAFLTVIYTGLLLGYSQPIALWHTALLPVLFFFSAVSTGIMAIMVVAENMGLAAEQLALLSKVDAVLIVLELFILVVFLYDAYRTIESRFSAKRILSGPVAPIFWLGVIVCGLVLPLLLEMSGGHGTTAILAAVLGLFGGLCLRFTVLAGGMITQITASGFEFARVARPKDPMPAIGKVPPS